MISILCHDFINTQFWLSESWALTYRTGATRGFIQRSSDFWIIYLMAAALGYCCFCLEEMDLGNDVWTLTFHSAINSLQEFLNWSVLCGTLLILCHISKVFAFLFGSFFAVFFGFFCLNSSYLW